ncbi:4773_t:CDS:1, partial [Gigaspora rosea]
SYGFPGPLHVQSTEFFPDALFGTKISTFLLEVVFSPVSGSPFRRPDSGTSFPF